MIRNFYAGPGALPQSVLQAAQEAVRELPGSGLSILGLSHRAPRFREILDEAEELIRRLLKIPPDYHVLFLQGGGTLQFSMVPLALLRPGRVGDYVVSGYWSQKSIDAGACHGAVRAAWDGTADGYRRLPSPAEPLGGQDSAYLHYVSNETVEGLQFRGLPRTAVPLAPLVCDASSDFLSRPLDVTPFTVLYAHAQKNIGPAGVTVVLLRDQVVREMPTGIAPVLDYRAHAEARSLLHTPPVFSIYVVLLCLRWLAEEVGGLDAMGRINAAKAAAVRAALAEAATFYRDDVDADCASEMNVTFRCPTVALDEKFVAQADQVGLVGTAGHRSRGGLRVSLYNGVTLEDARAMAAFIAEFAHTNRRAAGAIET